MSRAHAVPVPPVPVERPHQMEIHGDVRIDPYFWMKERENPEVVNHLKAENDYAAAIMAPQQALRAQLVSEMKARIQQDESSYPFFQGGYYYQTRYEPGKEYPIYVRRPGSLAAKEEILLDVNKLAKGKKFISVPFPTISPDSSKMIYMADNSGDRFYDLYVKDLAKGKLIGSPIRKTAGSAEWANDSRTIFYAMPDPETVRSRWIYRRELGSKKSTLIFEEKDETFDVEMARARTNAYLYIKSSSTLADEWQIIDANQPNSSPTVFLPREKGLEYSLEDGGDAFYVLTNWQAKNFRVMRAPHQPSPKEQWEEVVPNRDDTLLEDVTFFRTHYVLSERGNAQTSFTVVDRASGDSSQIRFPDAVYVATEAANPEFDATFFRYGYQSMNKPRSVFDYSFASRGSELRKTEVVPTFDSSQYETERLWAKARDGVLVPISLVYRKGFVRNGTAPLFVYGYGSYGDSSDPFFESNFVSLLDRGFVGAILHVRGGTEMGRAWYENGKLLKKMNTFTDFIDATEYLVQESYADPKRVYANGMSAGGLLMGAITNLRPDLYRGIVANVPFVDVLTTMLDETIPLTTGEYDEWGDPRKENFYRAMAEYSPYDQVKAQAYPHLFITAGYNDSQVGYWEPAKWAAKLRKLKTNDNLVLLKTEMEAGHGGASGRFQALEQTALEYSFYLMLDAQAVGK